MSIQSIHNESSTKDGLPPITYSRFIFWTAACLFLFWALGYRGLWGPEGRWAEVTREMFLNRDFFHPTINGEPYFDKPLFTYWAIAIVTAITSRLDEWVARLPSAVAGILTLWATVSIGRRLWTERVGRTAGWILLTTYGFLFWSRTATADIENMAAITLAVSWYWSVRERPGFWAYLGFYLICLIGSEFKGLSALAVPILVIFPDLIRGHRWSKYLTISHLMALAIALVVYLIPFIIATKTASGYQENGLAMVFQENIRRYFMAFDHKEPFYVYFRYLPLLFLPWTPLMLTAFAYMVRSYKRLDAKTKWALEAVVLIFLFYTLSGSRRSYYILPIFPFCAILTSLFLCVSKGIWRRMGLSLQGTLVLLLAMVEVWSPVMWSVVEGKMGFVPPGLKIATFVAGILGLVPWVVRHFLPNFLEKITGTGIKAAPVIAATAVLIGIFFCWQLNDLEAYRTKKPFLMELKARLDKIPSISIATYRKNMADVAFYLDPPGALKILKDNNAVVNFFAKGRRTKVLIARKKDLDSLLPALPRDLRRHPILSSKVLHETSTQLLAWESRKL